MQKFLVLLMSTLMTGWGLSLLDSPAQGAKHHVVTKKHHPVKKQPPHLSPPSVTPKLPPSNHPNMPPAKTAAKKKVESAGKKNKQPSNNALEPMANAKAAKGAALAEKRATIKEKDSASSKSNGAKANSGRKPASVTLATAAGVKDDESNGNGTNRRSLSTKKADQDDLFDLGLAIFSDTRLSRPAGVACITCHNEATDYTSGNVAVSAGSGLMPGSIPGRHTQHNVPPIRYTDGALGLGKPLHHDSALGWVDGKGRDGRFSFVGNQVSPHPLRNQVHFLVDNKEEMNSIPAYVVHQIKTGPYVEQFKTLFGKAVFDFPADEVFNDAVVSAVVAFESSRKTSPFTSKWDAYQLGLYEPTALELHGWRLMTGSWTARPGGPQYVRTANCTQCHGIKEKFEPQRPEISDLWSNNCYVNVGPPINPDDPLDNGNYTSTAILGLAAHLYPFLGLPANNNADTLGIRGAFRTYTLRNAALRQAFFHNASVKTIEDVITFYNGRNLTDLGEVIDFTKSSQLMTAHPIYKGQEGQPIIGKPLFKLEYPDANTLQNPQGLLANFPDGSQSTDNQVGNLGLSLYDKAAIAASIRGLTDGFFVRPTPLAPIGAGG